MKRILILFIFFFLCGCEKEVLSSQIYPFNTNISIMLYQGSNKDLQAVKDIFYHYYYLVDYQNERSEVNVYTLNQEAYNKEVVVSKDLYDLIKCGIDCYYKTDGYCNIAIGAASYKWQKMIDEKNYHLDVLQEETNNIKINDIIMNDDNLSVKYNNEYLKIDLGSIAKGYALEKAMVYLKEKSINKYIINAGTSSIGLGLNSKGGEYNVHIIDPTDISKTFKSMSVSNKCLSTSGDYQDSFIYDDEVYHHILSPNLNNAHYYKSVTLIGNNAYLADALSTALFSMPFEKASKMAEKEGFNAVFYMYDGTVKEI